jgi:hypothetical protein
VQALARHALSTAPRLACASVVLGNCAGCVSALGRAQLASLVHGCDRTVASQLVHLLLRRHPQVILRQRTRTRGAAAQRGGGGGAEDGSLDVSTAHRVGACELREVELAGDRGLRRDEEPPDALAQVGSGDREVDSKLEPAEKCRVDAVPKVGDENHNSRVSLHCQHVLKGHMRECKVRKYSYVGFLNLFQNDGF